MNQRQDTTVPHTTSEQYAAMAAKGDLDAFEALMRRHEKGVYNLAYSRTFSPDDSFDIAQETFLRVYRSIASFRGESTFSTWLYRICVNVISDHQKKNNNRRKHEIPLEYSGPDGEETAYDLPDHTYNPETAALRGERVDLVRREIDKLSEKYRLPLVLRDINGLSYNNIAAILGLELGTVKSRIKRARESLKDILEKDGFFG